MSNNASSPPPSLADLLWARFSILLGIKRRVHFLRAFVDELHAVTRRKRFQIRNDIVWNMVLDARDKCVIDLYSLSVEMRHGMQPFDPGARVNMRKRGMFRIIRDHYCADLSSVSVRRAGDDEFEFKVMSEGRAKHFARLFPGCAASSPSARDVEQLCERFRLAMIPLGKDRNKNRAHVHEGDFGKVPMQSVEQLEKLFADCEMLLEDLSLVSPRAAVFGRQNMNHAHCPSTAADLVDLILFGHTRDVVRTRGSRSRDGLLARLHEIDDERLADGDDKQLSFNQRQFDPSFEGFADVMGWT